jgi:flagellar hook assembly protein FlgD
VDPAGAKRAFLFPARPNPFGQETLIRYAIAGHAGGIRTVLSVHDPAGRLIRTLVDADQPIGNHRATWDGTSEAGEPVAAGVYFYRLRANGDTETRQAILVR